MVIPTAIAFQNATQKYLFAALYRLAPKRCRVVPDCRYGEHPAQQLDLYLPHKPEPGLAPVMFIHGGSWCGGTRADYRYVGLALAAAGIRCAVIGYRLFPETRFPGFMQDAASALAWLQDTGAIHGFGHRPTILLGHSAGAHIASLLALDERYQREQNIAPDVIAGVIGMSGVYKFKPEESAFFDAIFNSAAPDYRRVKPINFVGAKKPPLLLLHGDQDKMVSVHYARQMVEAAQLSGQRAELMTQRGYGHIRPLFDFVPGVRGHARLIETVRAFASRHA